METSPARRGAEGAESAMIAYRDRKIENAVCFFASEHRKRAKRPLYQTYLYKYLAFLDFESLKETGRPALGLTYRAMERGPVPLELYGNRANLRTELYEFVQDRDGNRVVQCRKDPDLGWFSPREIRLMKRLVEIYASRYVDSRLMSDSSHEEIAAWRKTWKRQPNAVIDYSLTFDEGFAAKPESELSCPESSYLVFKAIEEH